MKKTIKKAISVFMVLMLLVSSAVFISGCEFSSDPTPTPKLNLVSDKNPVVTMEIKNYGTVFIELYPDQAPNTVNNFISLIESGFYDGQKILRVCEGFCIQMGSPTGNPADDCGYTIPGEFSGNGFTQNTVKHEAGTLSMARAQDPDSASSQFFVCVDDTSASHLDGQYAAFGKVVAGLDIIIAISNLDHDYSYGYAGGGAPLKDVIIKSMTVNKKGIEYDAPAKS